MVNNKTVYRYIPEGKGGYFTFREPEEDDETADETSPELISRIGTYGCSTCVGVYFAIDATHAFAAHIKAYEKKKDGTLVRHFTEIDGQQLQADVLHDLGYNSIRHGWIAAQVVKDSIVVVCPAGLHNDPDGSSRKGVGFWILEVIKEFLDVDNPTIHDGQQGFVVKHNGVNADELTLVEYNDDNIGDNAPAPFELAEFDAKTEPSLENWSYGLSNSREDDVGEDLS